MASRVRIAVIFSASVAAVTALIYGFLRLMPYLMLVLAQHAAQAPIHCWVRVVDQDGNGVQGYSCRIEEEHASWWPFARGKDRIWNVKSGEGGYFEYRSKGATGRVFLGYPYDLQWRLNPEHLLQTRNLSVIALHQQTEVKKNPSSYLGSKENPFLLHVFTLGPPQRLMYNKVAIMLKNPHEWFCMDILSGKTWGSERPEGDIAMADGFGTRGHPAPCIVTIKAGPNCDLFPVLDDWGLGPPIEGYSKEICWPKSWEPRHYSLLGLWFYFRITRTGSPDVLYGKVKFGVREKVNGAVIECFTNLQGERNLYFKGYEKSVFTFDPCQISDYVSPPVQ